MKHTLMLLAAFLLAPLAALDAAELSRPNILWIVAEDINPNFGCYGDAYAVTPVLDKLAQEGIRFAKGPGSPRTMRMVPNALPRERRC